MIEDANIHKGHRARMRSKLLWHGARIFDTYELLEMLLYSVIPHRDTNPTAKRLLDRFGSLDGVLRADAKELATVEGIGDRAAEFIALVGAITDPVEVFLDEEREVFDDPGRVGEHFVKFFEDEQDYSVAVLLLDGGMHPIATEKLYSIDYGSGAVKASAFIDAAMRWHAAVAIVAHVHPHGAVYPTPQDMATGHLVRDGLAAVGVNLVDHFIVGGSRFMHYSSAPTRFAQTPSLRRYLEKNRGQVGMDE